MNCLKTTTLVLILSVFIYSCSNPFQQGNAEKVAPIGEVSKVWSPDNGDGSYTNPIIFADYSDPDVVRLGDDYYMTSSSFNCVPALPILHSKDLVNWKIVNHVFDKQKPLDVFDKPQHGNGVWAPAFRYHNGEFYIYWGDPDFGIYMVKAQDPAGEWSEPHLVKSGKGWIDPCPLWDDDGKAYLVHAWAGSRAKIKSILTVHEMSPDGKELLDDGVMVFDGHVDHRTVEGSKFYKKNGYYYIFAPAGGVPTGWQLVLRSKDVWGPYEHRTVLHRGNTDINGPHQGGWVSTQTGEDWFIHFQDREAYGRIVHLQPMAWNDGWPIIGVDINNDGIGEPVLTHKKPNVGAEYPVCTPQVSDEFNEPKIGLQWQWHANNDPRFGGPSGRLGFLRLNALTKPKDYINFWQVPNLLLQKFTAEEFTATAKFEFFPSLIGDKTGLIIMGENYSYLQVVNEEDGLKVQQVICENARIDGPENIVFTEDIAKSEFYLQVKVSKGAICNFLYSTDGKDFKSVGEPLSAVPGRWIGAKVGFFALAEELDNNSGYVNIDWFRVEK